MPALHRSLATSLSPALALALALACSSKTKTGEPPAVREIDGLDAIPAGSQVVLGGDVAKLAGSALIRRGVEAVFARDPALAARIEAITTECELVPGENVESFIIGMGESPDETLMVVRGKFVENALAACVQRSLGESGGRLTTKTVGGRTVYLAASGLGKSTVFFGLGSPRSLMVASSEDWLAKAFGAGPRVTSDREMAALLAKAPTDATLWGVGLVAKDVGAGLVVATDGEVGAPRAMVAQLDVWDGLEASLRVELNSKDDANRLKLMAEAQKPVIAAIAQKWLLGTLVSEKIQFVAEEKSMILRVSATGQELSDLLAAVDTGGDSLQNPQSDDVPGEDGDGKRDTPADGKAPLR